MKTPIVDDREHNVKMLSQIDFGQYCYIGERLCRRISTELKVEYFDDELLVNDEATGELISIDRNKLVEPVKVEIHIVE